MWNEFESKEFIFEERKATVVYPNVKPVGRILFKTEYLNAFPGFDIAMLEKGYYLVYIQHSSRWAPDDEIERMARFVCHCAEMLNADKRVVLEGLSCGGLSSARFAEKHPGLSAVLYLDAPVLNVLSLVGLGECKGDFIETHWREVAATFGVSRSTIINFRKSAIDNMEPLIENNIPIIMVYGNSDNVVIYEENGRVLEDFYKEKGGVMKVICKSMCNHHPHGLDDPQPIVDFIEKNYK